MNFIQVCIAAHCQYKSLEVEDRNDDALFQDHYLVSPPKKIYTHNFTHERGLDSFYEIAEGKTCCRM